MIKLSSPATQEFWEVPVLFEDEHLMALNKPAGLLVSPDRYDPNRPNLMKLLHAGIEAGKPWAKERNVTYLMNAHRLDFETSGVILLAKSKPVLVDLVTQFGSEKPHKVYATFVRGTPPGDTFDCDAKLAPNELRLGLMRVDPKRGKKSKTQFSIRERFGNITLLECRPITGRSHQIRVHLKALHLPIIGDEDYGGQPLLLSALKGQGSYRLKRGKTERPLISRVALHAEKLMITHPITKAEVNIEAPWPKDLTVALKYLRRYASGQSHAHEEEVESPS
jgi:RluA family pseudouridine synthase